MWKRVFVIPEDNKRSANILEANSNVRLRTSLLTQPCLLGTATMKLIVVPTTTPQRSGPL